MIGHKLSSRYELREVLGRGGMATVYLGHDPWLDRQVAIKLLSTDKLSDSVVARFQREARLAASLDHPAIVPIFDFGRHENFLFFVMPVLRGETLAEHFRRGSLELPTMLELAAQVAEGLAYSAAHGVVHRDIKPGNLMVSERPGSSRDDILHRIWIMDFGLALASSGTRITRTGNLPGTLAYLSPEQVVSREIDGRADMYALATILYEYLAGGRPFSGPPAALLYRIVHDDAEPLQWQGVDPRLADLVHRCLAKEPSRRLEGEEFAAKLRHLTAHGLGSPRPGRQKQSQDDDFGHEVPLVGREEPMRQLQGALQRALQEGCQLWLIGGEAGLGKSRLLAEVQDVARQRGMCVLQGHFADREDAFPYQAFCELIEDFYRQQSQVTAVDELAASGAPTAGDLSELVPELLSYFPSLREVAALRDQAGDWLAASHDDTAHAAAWLGEEVGEGRLAIFECMAKTFSRFADAKPLMLSLENLQVADVSIEMLRYIARRLSSTPLLIVGTFRQEDVSRRHPLQSLCRGLDEDPRGGVVTLTALNEAEHRLLAVYLLSGTPIQDALASHLYATSEGNPFFLRELLRMLQDRDELHSNSRGELGLKADPWLSGNPLPDTIQHVVEAQLERLGEDQRELLAIASVLGRHFEFEDLVHLAGDRERADEAVELLLQRGFLEEDLRARGDVLRFSSGIMRDALYGGLPRRRRRHLHRRHAVALEERSRHRAELPGLTLMHHFSQADMADKAVHYALQQARQSLKSSSWDDLVRVTNVALQFIDEGPAADELAQMVDAEGEVRWLQAVALKASGKLVPGLRQAELAISAVQRQGSPDDVAEVALLAAEIAWQLRQVDKVQRWVTAGLNALADGGSHDLQRKLLVLGATVSNLQGDYAAAESLMARVNELPRSGDQEAGRRGGTLVTALPQPVTTLDPGSIETVEDIEVLANVFETLLQPDFDGRLLPALALRWRGEDDDRRFRFFLDPAARFSDGSPLLAQHVKASLQLLAGRSAYGCSRTAFAAIEGIEELLAGSTDELRGVTVVAEDELLVHLKECLPIFPVLLCGLGTAVVKPTDDGRLIGTGPFCLDDQSDGAIRLSRNPHGQGGGPHLDSLVFRTDLDAAAMARALQRGELDIARDLLPEDLDRLLRDARFRSQMVEANLRNIYLMMWNVHAPLARHGALRHALGRVLKVDELIWRTAGRFARPATSLVPPGILGHMEERAESLTLDAAKALLAEVPGPRPLRLRVSAHPIFDQRYGDFLQAVFAQWQQLGVEVDYEGGSVERFLHSWQEPRDVDVVIGRWLPEYDDPDGYMHLLLHSEVGYLHAFLASNELDAALQAARRERLPGRREELYRQIEGTLRRQDLLLPLFHDVAYRIAHPRIRGLRLLRHPPYVDYRRLSQAGPSSADAERSTRRRNLRFPLASEVASLDPLEASLADVAEVVPNVFETLTRVGEGAKVVPHLAERVTAEDGGRRFRIHLPVNVRFHDGRRLTSRDVHYSLQRLLGSAALSSQNAMVPLRGLRSFRRGETDQLAGLQIVSDHEIVIELSQPLAFFPALLALPTTGIVAAGAESFVDTWREGCVGTGPFRIHRFRAGQRVELRAFPGYRRSGYPKCDGLTFELGMSSQDIAAQFRAGELSLASQLRPADVDQLRREHAMATNFRQMPGISTYFLVTNVLRGPLQDAAVRRRVAQVLDLDGAVRGLGSLGSRARGLIPPGLLTPDGNELVRQAPPEEGPSLQGLVLRVGLNSVYSDQHGPLWSALAKALAAAGVVLHIVARDTPAMFEAVQRGDVDLVATRWLGDYPDADCFVSRLHSREGKYGPMCGDPDLDARIEDARGEEDPVARHGLYRSIDRQLSDRHAVIPIFHEPIYRFCQPHVEGLRLAFGAPEVAYEELRLVR